MANTTSDPAPPRPMAVVCFGIAAIDGYSVRPWCSDDAPALAAAWSDPEIARWNPVPPEASEDLAARWIAGASRQTVASIGIDVVLLNEVSEVCGEIGLQIDPAQNIAEVGFWLRAESRRCGAGRYLLEFAAILAHEVDVVGLVALTDPENHRAIELLQRSGWPEMPTKSQRRAFAKRVAHTPEG